MFYVLKNTNSFIFACRTIISVFIFLTVLGSSLTVYDYWKTNQNFERNQLIDSASEQTYGTLQTLESSINNTAGTEYQASTSKFQHTRTKAVSEDRTDLISPTNTELQTVILHVQPPSKVLITIFFFKLVLTFLSS